MRIMQSWQPRSNNTPAHVVTPMTPAYVFGNNTSDVDTHVTNIFIQEQQQQQHRYSGVYSQRSVSQQQSLLQPQQISQLQQAQQSPQRYVSPPPSYVQSQQTQILPTLQQVKPMGMQNSFVNVGPNLPNLTQADLESLFPPQEPQQQQLQIWHKEGQPPQALLSQVQLVPAQAYQRQVVPVNQMKNEIQQRQQLILQQQRQIRQAQQQPGQRITMQQNRQKLLQQNQNVPQILPNQLKQLHQARPIQQHQRKQTGAPQAATQFVYNHPSPLSSGQASTLHPPVTLPQVVSGSSSDLHPYQNNFHGRNSSHNQINSNSIRVSNPNKVNPTKTIHTPQIRVKDVDSINQRNIAQINCDVTNRIVTPYKPTSADSEQLGQYSAQISDMIVKLLENQPPASRNAPPLDMPVIKEISQPPSNPATLEKTNSSISAGNNIVTNNSRSISVIPEVKKYTVMPDSVQKSPVNNISTANQNQIFASNKLTRSNNFSLAQKPEVHRAGGLDIISQSRASLQFRLNLQNQHASPESTLNGLPVSKFQDLETEECDNNSTAAEKKNAEERKNPEDEDEVIAITVQSLFKEYSSKNGSTLGTKNQTKANCDPKKKTDESSKASDNSETGNRRSSALDQFLIDQVVDVGSAKKQKPRSAVENSSNSPFAKSRLVPPEPKKAKKDVDGESAEKPKKQPQSERSSTPPNISLPSEPKENESEEPTRKNPEPAFKKKPGPKSKTLPHLMSHNSQQNFCSEKSLPTKAKKRKLANDTDLNELGTSPESSISRLPNQGTKAMRKSSESSSSESKNEEQRAERPEDQIRKLNKLKAIYGDDPEDPEREDELNRKRKSSESESCSSRRKLSKTSIVKNKNNEREMISLKASKPAVQKKDHETENKNSDQETSKKNEEAKTDVKVRPKIGPKSFILALKKKEEKAKDDKKSDAENRSSKKEAGKSDVEKSSPKADRNASKHRSPKKDRRDSDSVLKSRKKDGRKSDEVKRSKTKVKKSVTESRKSEIRKPDADANRSIKERRISNSEKRKFDAGFVEPDSSICDDSKKEDNQKNCGLLEEDVEPEISGNLSSPEHPSSTTPEESGLESRIRAFRNVESYRCLLCAKTIPTDLLWINMKTTELRCEGCSDAEAAKKALLNGEIKKLNELRREIEILEKKKRKLKKGLVKYSNTKVRDLEKMERKLSDRGDDDEVSKIFLDVTRRLKKFSENIFQSSSSDDD